MEYKSILQRTLPTEITFNTIRDRTNRTISYYNIKLPYPFFLS